MTNRLTERDLVDLLRSALAAADDLGLWGVGARLDQALVDLTGIGVLPVEETPAPATENA
ncbi:MAG: hypothetical protein V4472_05010 [Pseudomonadota bacterium]